LYESGDAGGGDRAYEEVDNDSEANGDDRDEPDPDDEALTDG
jgi:hypothetical protein